jgi:FkbM family methyltransferase
MTLKKKITGRLRQIGMHWATRITPLGDEIALATNKEFGEPVFFPYKSRLTFDYRQLHNHSKSYFKYLEEKYTQKEFTVLPTDTVIDCGAFVGGFTVAAARAGAKRVISVEPSSRNFRCLNLNVARQGFTGKVTTLNNGLGSKPGVMNLNLSESGCDDSLLEPDEGATGEIEKVNVITLAGMVKEFNIEPKNLFLKVEAEGFEPEIIQGLEDVMPRVITVDITPERDGDSPLETIREILVGKGYTHVEVTPRCLFATIR